MSARRAARSRARSRPRLPLLPCLFGLVWGACGESQSAGPRGDLTFAVLGDAPYNGAEERQFDYVIDALNADSLDWVIHVGDLFWTRCSEENLRERRELLSRIRHPVIYTPGDNEWTDCWGRREGGFRPLDRLATLRRIYFPEPDRSLGGRRLGLVSQSADFDWSEFVENRRWAAGGIVFATVHLVGSWNGREDFPGRTEANDREAERRTHAAVAWLAEAFAEAREIGARAVFLATHAHLVLEDPGDPYRESFEPFLEALEREVAAFPGEVVLAHGDNHEFTWDRPLVDRASGDTLRNFSRLQVMGSPDVGWVRVVVDTTAVTFEVEPRRVSALRMFF